MINGKIFIIKSVAQILSAIISQHQAAKHSTQKIVFPDE